MIPSSTAVFTAAAASLLLGPALATSSSHPDPEILRAQTLNPDGPARWLQAQDAAAPTALTGGSVSHATDEDEGAAEGAPGVAVSESTVTRETQSDGGIPASEGTPLDGRPELKLQPELRRSQDGGEGGTVLLRRETSAAPTIYGVSIWLILAWLGLLYLMYRTGSL